MAINPNYDVLVKANYDVFKYKNCEVQDVLLKKFQELPQNLKWAEPKITEDGKYFGAHGIATKSSEEDYVLIWERAKPEAFIYQYHRKNIGGYEFAPNSKTFVIIYEKSKPIYYNIASGHPIRKLETKEVSVENAITSSFSPHGKYFGLATKAGFVIWNVLDGTIVSKLEDESPSKYIRKDILVSIAKNGKVKMIKFKEVKVLKEMQLEGVTSNEQILNCMISPDMNYFYYILKDGVYKIEISTGETSQVQPFENTNSVLGLISFDCKEYLTSSNEMIEFWAEEKGKTGAMAKEKFYHMSVHFQLHLLITIDDISINITDEANPETDEAFVWTNLNQKEFHQFIFSPDFLVLLVIVNDHHAVLYNSATGKVVRQWYNKLDHWSKSCQLVSKESLTALIATKSTESCIKLWNYNNGNEYISLYGFNAYSTNFNPEGNLLCAGTMVGDEIARAWELNSGDHISYMNPGSSNRRTYARITAESKYLIAQSVSQPPILFEVDTAHMVFKCQGTVFFKQVNHIASSQDLKYFYCQGLSTLDETPFATIYSIDSPNPIEEINHCTSIDISSDSKYLLVKIKPEEGDGLLKQYDLQNNLKTIQYKDNSEYSQFLQDNKTIVSSYGDEKKTVFILYSTAIAVSFGEIMFEKKIKDFSQVEISASDDETGIIIRHISF